MANVLNEEKKQQVLTLGRLGWSLRRIQQVTRIRRETASAYLRAAGIAVRPPLQLCVLTDHDDLRDHHGVQQGKAEIPVRHVHTASAETGRKRRGRRRRMPGTKTARSSLTIRA